MSYTPVSITGYNANPPTDDGASTANNEIAWQKHLDKIGAPLKTAIGTMQTNIGDAIRCVIPSGTVCIFAQTAAPTGFTKGATHNNKALRVVTGTASSGGSTAFTSVFTSRTIAKANLPSYNLGHNLDIANLGITPVGNYVRASTFTSIQGGSGTVFTDVPVSATAVTPTLASSVVDGTIASDGSGTAMDFAVQYVDVILATKN